MSIVEPLLSVDLSVDYSGRPGVLRELKFQIGAGEIVGLAGQSGSGKSTLALAVMRLLCPRRTKVRGAVHFRGKNLLTCTSSEMRAIRGKEIGMAFQAASSALNPHLRIETQLKAVWKAHEKTSWDIGRERALETLRAMDLQCDAAFLRRYSREVSIGQAQRIILAMALLHRPALLIADEPTSALDLVAQAELLQLLKRVNREFGTAMLYISHDLATVGYLCHRVCILNRGTIVESGTPDDVFDRPQAAFTQDLITAHRILNSQQVSYPQQNCLTPLVEHSSSHHDRR
jgi:ABC-type glutathione transport system ATPase component